MTMTARMRKNNPPDPAFPQYTLESALWQLKASCTHHGRKMLRVCLGLLRRDAQALADVRMLDEWAEQNPTQPAFQTVPSAFPLRGKWGCYGGYEDYKTSTRRRGFYGATPDEARAKAAAWVREQAK